MTDFKSGFIGLEWSLTLSLNKISMTKSCKNMFIFSVRNTAYLSGFQWTQVFREDALVTLDFFLGYFYQDAAWNYQSTIITLKLLKIISIITFEIRRLYFSQLFFIFWKSLWSCKWSLEQVSCDKVKVPSKNNGWEN